MAFPDSSKKAPNVFFNTYDSTGAPIDVSSAVHVSAVINAKRNIAPVIYSPVVSDNTQISGLSVVNGILSSYEYATSVTYPMLATDTYRVADLQVNAGSLFGSISESFVTLPLSIHSGSLITTIAYIGYTDSDTVSVSGIQCISCSLDTTIAYIEYTPVTEDITTSGMPVVSGSLITTIEYIIYNNGNIENVTVAGLTILSGSLT